MCNSTDAASKYEFKLIQIPNRNFYMQNVHQSFTSDHSLMNILYAECSSDADKLINTLHGECSSVKILCNPTDAIASKYNCKHIKQNWIDTRNNI